MAVYEAQCSAVGGFGYANYFKLYVELTDGNISGNTSKITFNVYCKSSGSGSINATHLKYFRLNGVDVVNQTVNVNVSSPNAYITIASGTTGAIQHDSDGNKSVSFSAQIKGTTYGVSASVSGTFNLTKIGGNAPIFTTNPSVTGRTLSSLTFDYGVVNINSDLYYSLDNSNWVHITAQRTTINNLTANKTYTIYVQARSQANNSLRTTKSCSGTTLDIARISSVSNFNHGDNTSVSITNPASISSLSLVMKIGDTQILSRTVKAGSNTITFSDTELDNIYKKYGSGSSVTATFIVSGSGYTNSKTCTITLKGNQKTGRTNVSNSWKRGKIWTNVNGAWKRAVFWTNVNGTWKRGI